MKKSARTPVGLLVLVGWLAALGCAAPAAPTGQQGSAAQPATAQTKHITVAVLGDPPFIYTKINPRGTVGSADDMVDLLHVGLTHVDRAGVRGPRLASEVPTAENGLWQIFPDGRMQLTWKIDPKAHWHDGTPVTAEDMVFTAKVVQDRDLPLLRERVYDLIESIEAPDSRTVVSTWKQPYIEADALFTYALALPFPKHLLEAAHNEDKATFFDHPYWNTEFVGAGAFRLKEFVRSSHMLLEANPDYVLGRPKIDQMEVKFIPDSNPLITSLLAGTVDIAVGRNISLDQAVQVRDQWRNGRMDIGLKSWHVLYPQFVNPNPEVVADVRFRRALLHGIDREQLAETLVAGFSSVAHNYVNPQETEHQETDRNVARYEYDVRKAQQMIEELGYQRGADGMFRGGSGQPLTVSMDATGALDIPPKAMFAVADYWRRMGVEVETSVVPIQLSTNREHMSTFSSFQVSQNPDSKAYLTNFHSSNTPLPSNNFVGGNSPRYQNAQWDSLLERYFTTVPIRERTEVLSQIVAHISDQLPLMGLFYNAEPTMINNRLQNAWARAHESGQGRNVHEWEVK